MGHEGKEHVLQKGDLVYSASVFSEPYPTDHDNPPFRHSFLN